ncbi:hypothetical protein LguiB_018643 [Lonicera macranthoides]
MTDLNKFLRNSFMQGLRLTRNERIQYYYREVTAESLWTRDLVSLERELDVLDDGDEQDEVDRKVMKGKVMNEAGLKVSKHAPKNRQKDTKKANNVEHVAEPMETSDNVPEVVKPKGRTAPKKAPTKRQGKSSLSLRDEDTNRS